MPVMILSFALIHHYTPKLLIPILSTSFLVIVSDVPLSDKFLSVLLIATWISWIVIYIKLLSNRFKSAHRWGYTLLAVNVLPFAMIAFSSVKYLLEPIIGNAFYLRAAWFWVPSAFYMLSLGVTLRLLLFAVPNNERLMENAPDRI